MSDLVGNPEDRFSQSSAPLSFAGKWTLWSVVKVFEAIRYVALPAGFAYYERFRDNYHSIFMAGTTYKVSKEANNLRAKTHWGRNFPLYAYLKVIYVGKSSFSFEIQLRDYKTGVGICSATLTFVFVDFKSRRPAPFPAWFRDKCSERQDLFGGSPPPRLPTIECQPEVFKYETKAMFSDIDFNGHVNQSVFVRWCTDAGAEAASKGFYRDFNQDLGFYDVKKMEVKYIGEGMIDEEFVVMTWQDDVIPFTIHFQITKQGKPAFVGRFSYAKVSNSSSKL